MNALFPLAENVSSPPLIRALTIAGSDSGGGAGIQADLKTFTLMGVFGLSVITALTAQNSLGVQSVFGLPEDFVGQQMDSVLNDIGTDAAKTGMLWSQGIIEVVADKLKGKNYPLVVDPVLTAKRGEPLLQPEAIPALKQRLLPLANLVTPNIPEAELLSGLSPLTTKDQIQDAAKKIMDLSGAESILIKGGHLSGDQIFDLFFDGRECMVFEKERINTQHVHGVGCTLAATITAFLAYGLTVIEAVQKAQTVIREAIRSSLPLGQGIGSVNLRFCYLPEEKYHV